MRQTQTRGLGLIFGVLAGLYGAQAKAATTGVEYVAILLDQTGSMATTINGSSTVTFWDNAVSAAQAWVLADDSVGRPRRAYAVWTFFDNACPGCGGGTQNGAQQVWPKLDGSSTDCGPGNNSQFESSTGFCVFGTTSTTDDTPYLALSNRLGDPGDATATNIRNAFRAITGVGNTPLADSMCSMLEMLQLQASANSKVLILETDAGENDSINFCSSAISTTALPSGATAFNKAQTSQTAGTVGDWGLSQDVANPSWQAKVMRRAVRINGTNTGPSSTPSTNTAHGQLATGTPIATGEDLPSGSTGYKLRVDAHFMICHPSNPPPCPTTGAFNMMAMPGINLPSLGIVAQAAMEPKGSLRAPAAAQLKVTQTMTAPITATTTTAAPKTATLSTAAVTTAATTSPGVPLIDANEFLFFQALGHINSKSSFHAVVSDSAVVFGTNHRIPGDVDDSGCTDRADLSIIKQKDVYYQRAVRPLEIAIRADLNRDGWVTKADAQIVLDNWGRGCINNPGPKPKI